MMAVRLILKRSFFLTALLLAFLLTQLGAVQHSVAHLSDVQTGHQDKAPAHKKACDLCLGYAGFSGSLPQSDFQVALLQNVVSRVVSTYADFFLSTPFHFHSRAPPRL